MGCQALWFFSFCQQVVSTVSPQLYLMWPSCSATDVEAQYQGSSAPALVTLGLPGEARGQSTHTYFLLTPALGASENSLVLSAMTIETSPTPTQGRQGYSHLFNSCHLLSSLFSSSISVSGTIIHSMT